MPREKIGQMPCKSCDGTGELEFTKEKCLYCDGSGLVPVYSFESDTDENDESDLKEFLLRGARLAEKIGP